MGMRKARGRARFLSEAGRKIEGPHDVLPDQLHGDRSLEHFVHGCVDRTHSPAAKATLEAVATVEQAGTARRRQRLMVVRAHVCASVEASPAALALGQGVPIARRAFEQQSHGVRDGHQEIEILLVVGLLRTPGPEHEKCLTGRSPEIWLETGTSSSMPCSTSSARSSIGS